MGRREEVVAPVDDMDGREVRSRLNVARMVRLTNASPGDTKSWEVRRDIAAKLGPEASQVEVVEATMKALGLTAEYKAALARRGF